MLEGKFGSFGWKIEGIDLLSIECWRALVLDENEIASCVMEISFDLHRRLGPGLLESAYEALLERKLLDAGIAVSRQVEVPIVFDGIRVETAYRADLIVAGKVVVELKSVEELHPVYYK